jgi:hypothetical protein
MTRPDVCDGPPKPPTRSRQDGTGKGPTRQRHPEVVAPYRTRVMGYRIA